MRAAHTIKDQRGGVVVILLAVLLIPMLAMVAFAVDIAWIALAEADLQHAADSAALAGAGQLMNGYVQYYLPGQSSANQTSILSTAQSSAKTYAKNFAGYNGAGGVTSLTLLDSDIEFGYTDSSNNYTACPTWTGYPNTVKVTLRRDSTANNSLPLFFGPALGASTTDLRAVAAATIYTGTVNNVNGSSSSINILPMTFDVNHWNNFLKTGQSPDGTKLTDSSGNPDISVYPSIKYDGNFGLLSLDQGNDGASTISGWINNGVSQSDLANEYNNVPPLLPLSAHSQLLWNWKGNPGLKDSDIQAVGGQVGQTYLLPLFKPVNDGSLDPTLYQAGVGNGSHYYYNIIQFVGIKIISVDSGGNNKSIMVEPTAYIDPSLVLTGVTPAAPPASGTSQLTTTFAPPKLTQ